MKPSSLDDLLAIYEGDANVRAFYMVVRKGESSLEPIAYRMRFGGAGGTQYFDNFADHPRVLVEIPWDTHVPKRKSSAAGAPQITATTYDYLRGLYTGVNDYTPRTQDGLYVGCLIKTGALELVRAGRFDEAVAAARDEWTSLPGAAENNPKWTLAKARELYLQHGGALSAQPVPVRDPPPTATPQTPAVAGQPFQRQGARMGTTIALPLLAQLIPQVLGLFSTRAQATIAEKTGADPKVAADFMQAMIAQVGHAVGVPVVDNASATQAVAALTAAPPETQAQMAKALEAQALATVDAILKAGDKMSAWDQAKWDAETKGRDAATDRAIRAAKAGLWDPQFLLVLAGALVTTLGSLGLIAAIVAQSMAKWVFRVEGAQGIDPVLIAFAAPLVTLAFQCWQQVFAYRFDGTKDSTEQSKALINALPRQPQQ